MPYIKNEDKTLIDARIQEASKGYFEIQDIGCQLKNSGELNYVITCIIKHYFYANGGRYQQINDVIGALEGAKAEFGRRIVIPYEDRKRKENGDVY